MSSKMSPKKRSAPKLETPQRKVHQSERNVKLKEVQAAQLRAEKAQQASLETERESKGPIERLRKEMAAAREAIRRKGNQRDSFVRKRRKARLEAVRATEAANDAEAAFAEWQSANGEHRDSAAERKGDGSTEHGIADGNGGDEKDVSDDDDGRFGSAAGAPLP
jgi:hypothetical protein